METKLKFYRLQPPACDFDVAKLEDRLGYTLPEDYKEWLRVINACAIDYFVEGRGPRIPIRGNGPQIPIYDIFGISPIDTDGDAEARKSLRDYPGWALPIAEGGEYFIMDLRPEKRGTIYLHALDWTANDDPVLSPADFMDSQNGPADELTIKVLRDVANQYFFAAESFSSLLAYAGIDMKRLDHIREFSVANPD